jgi:hypothetical protein
MIVFDIYCPAYEAKYKNWLHKYINNWFPNFCRPTLSPLFYQFGDTTVMNPIHKDKI